MVMQEPVTQRGIHAALPARAVPLDGVNYIGIEPTALMLIRHFDGRMPAAFHSRHDNPRRKTAARRLLAHRRNGSGNLAGVQALVVQPPGRPQWRCKSSCPHCLRGRSWLLALGGGELIGAEADDLRVSPFIQGKELRL